MALIDLIDIVPMDSEAHFKFCINNWLKSAESITTSRDGITSRQFYMLHHPVVEKLLNDKKTKLAVYNQDQDVYFGWACGSPGHLYYVYVKYAHNGNGIAKKLIQSVCGDDPGVFHAGTYNIKFIEYLHKKGWTYGDLSKKKPDTRTSKKQSGKDTARKGQQGGGQDQDKAHMVQGPDSIAEQQGSGPVDDLDKCE